jgi:hypothetical protein
MDAGGIAFLVPLALAVSSAMGLLMWGLVLEARSNRRRRGPDLAR